MATEKRELSDDELKQIDELMGPAPEEAPAGTFTNHEADAPVQPLQAESEEDRAIEAIVKSESDAVLEAQKEPEPSSQKRPNLIGRLGGFLKSLVTHKKRRRYLLVSLFIAVLLVICLPTSRYALLNAAGVKVSSSVTVIDDTSGQPIAKVKVTIGTISAETDKDGIAQLADLPVGPNDMLIRKAGYADSFEPLVLGWGSNPLGERKLVATGIRVPFELTDWLSGKPVVGVDITSGDSSVITDEAGKARLVLPDEDSQTATATITAKDYRTEEITIDLNAIQPEVLALVPKLPLAFFSKRTGTYDLYQIDADGKNETLLVKGTGTERDAMTLTVSADGRYIGFVSSRDGERSGSGYIQDGLFIYDRETKQLTKHASAAQLRLLGWIDSSAVYVKVGEGESAADPEREKLIAYDVATDTARQLARSNQFNDIAIADGYVYVAESNTYGENPDAKLFRVLPDETDKKTMLDKQAWSLVRSSYDTFLVSSSGNKWHELTISTSESKDIAAPPSVPRDRRYVDNRQGSKSVWFDYRDGKGVIVLYDTTNKQETVLYTQGGLTTPLQWLSNSHVVYRLANLEETADYVLSIDGGEPKKIIDVVDIDSNGNRNFY